MYTIKEVAVRLGTSYSQARFLVRSGEISATNVGGNTRNSWRVSEKQLQEFILARGNKKAAQQRTERPNTRKDQE